MLVLGPPPALCRLSSVIHPVKKLLTFAYLARDLSPVIHPACRGVVRTKPGSSCQNTPFFSACFAYLARDLSPVGHPVSSCSSCLNSRSCIFIPQPVYSNFQRGVTCANASCQLPYCWRSPCALCYPPLRSLRTLREISVPGRMHSCSSTSPALRSAARASPWCRLSTGSCPNPQPV